jgi:hypothetical protein
MDQHLPDFTVESWQADIESSNQEEVDAIAFEVDLRIDRQFGRELDLPLARRELNRAHVAGRPSRAEQILGRRVRLGQLNVKETVPAVGCAVKAAGIVRLAGEEELGGHECIPFVSSGRSKMKRPDESLAPSVGLN